MNNYNKIIVFFFKKTFLFLGLFFIILISFICLTNNRVQRSKKYYHLPDDVRNLILGHSHVEYAYNDTIIKDALNLGQGGDSYFYIYLKLKQLLNSNTNVEHVLINFSNNQIDAKMDDRIWDDLHLNYKFSKYSAFTDLEDTQVLLEHNFRGYLGNLGYATRKNLSIILNPKSKEYIHSDWGGYNPNYTSRIDSIINLSDLNKKKINSTSYHYPLSGSNIYYLQKTIKLILNYKVKVFLIRTPVHERYHYLANEVKFDSVYNTDFSIIPFLDFKDYPLLNEQFADDSHLNYKGAKELSESLQQLIERGLLNSKNPQKLIDSVIVKLEKKRRGLYKPNYGYSLHHDKRYLGPI